MDPAEQNHPHKPTVRFDGGNLDCGNGLLLLIRKHIDPLATGELLEILSAEASVREDLPSWCRLTGNDLVSQIEWNGRSSFLVSKGRFRHPSEPSPAVGTGETRGPVRQESIEAVEVRSPELLPTDGLRNTVRASMPMTQVVVPVTIPDTLPQPTEVPAIRPLSVMGVGSWPRPRWLLRALHEYLEGRLDEAEFQESADDAVRLAVEAQRRAGVDVLTDGEQRRDDYAGFVGGLLDNCQLIPVTDLLPYVDHPQEFAAALKNLDVPADKVRHPAVFGPLGRSRPLAVRELEFVQSLADLPVKVALPGPYLLTRTMWMKCISDRAYDCREALADDVVRVLREELHFLLAAGAALVQFDEPVLTEVVFGRPESGNRTFMCGALGSKGPPKEEFAFAQSLINRVVAGLPRERLALHVCRGNWTTDERAALKGDYQPLLKLLSNIDVGTLFLECCTARAGELSVLSRLPETYRVGVGVIDQKSARIESPDEIVARAERAVNLFGVDRVLLNPDCGFATFADNPITSAQVAQTKLASLAKAARTLRRHYHVD